MAAWGRRPARAAERRLLAAVCVPGREAGGGTTPGTLTEGQRGDTVLPDVHVGRL